MAVSYLFSVPLLAGLLYSAAYVNSAIVNPQPKINGGVPVDLGELPYVVSVRNIRWGHTCSGSLIAPNAVLTSAICAQPAAIDNLSVVAGTIYSANVTDGEQIRKPSAIYQHPSFVFPLPEGDVSIVFFEEPFELNENVGIIALPPSDTPYSGNSIISAFNHYNIMCVSLGHHCFNSLIVSGFSNSESKFFTLETQVRVSGWGVENYGGPLSEVLETVISDVYTDEECADFNNVVVEPQIICTGGRLGNAAGCQGDAGTGLVSLGSEPYLVAVLSHYPCTTIEECGM